MMTEKTIAQRTQSSENFNRAHMFTLSAFVFLCFPFLGIYLLGMIGSLGKRSASLVLTPIVIFGSIFLALVASTKIVDGDLSAYIETFSSAQNLELDIFLLSQQKDPLYYTFIYIISRSGVVSDTGFVFLSVLFSYLLILWSTVRSGRFIQISPDKILIAIILLMYFGPLFSNSAHLMRQFLAGSVILLAFARPFENWKSRWFLVGVASLIHSSANLFILIFIIQILISKKSRSGAFIRALSAMCSLLIMRFASAPLSVLLSSMGLGTVSYAISRLSQGQFFNLKPLTIASLSYIVALSVMAFFVSSQKGDGKGGSMTPGHFVDVTLITASIIMASHLLGFHELSVRYMLYTYMFAGIIFACFLARIPLPTAPISSILALFLPILFVMEIDTGEWTYAPTWQIIFGSFYSFIR